MPESNFINTTGANIKRSDKLIEGVSNFGIQGAAAPEVDVTTLISEKREYFVGIADPGSMTFTMNFNPSDPVHLEMYDTLGSESFASYEVIFAGALVNGIKTKTGDVKGGDLKATVTNAGKLTVVSNTAPVRVGNYLKAEAVATEDLKVISGDYSVDGTTKWDVKKASDNTNPTAVGAAGTYKVVVPAQSLKFDAFVQAMPHPSQGREAALIAQVVLRMSGAVTWTIGTPDIA